MTQLKDYDPASPIQVIDGLVTTERSGFGKWGKQSQEGLLQYIRWLAHKLPENFEMVEIGCYAGESTLAFAHIAGKVWAVDPWKNGYDDDDLASSICDMHQVEESFDKRVGHFPNIIKTKKSSSNAALDWGNETIDFVYIDAIHKLGPCRDDINRWTKKIKQGGYIGGHDFCGYWGEVVDAVLETVGVPDFVTKDGSWASRRIN